MSFRRRSTTSARTSDHSFEPAGHGRRCYPTGSLAGRAFLCHRPRQRNSKIGQSNACRSPSVDPTPLRSAKVGHSIHAKVQPRRACGAMVSDLARRTARLSVDTPWTPARVAPPRRKRRFEAWAYRSPSPRAPPRDGARNRREKTSGAPSMSRKVHPDGSGRRPWWATG